MKRIFRTGIWLLAGGVVAALAGCSLLGGKGDGANTNSLGGVNPIYAVTAPSTAFYRYGPQQGYGADQRLPKETMMSVVRPSFGYSKVQLENGEQGYVASEDIKPASPDLIARAAAAKLPPAPIFSGPNANNRTPVDANDPRLAVPAEPLPQSSPKPDFRY